MTTSRSSRRRRRLACSVLALAALAAGPVAQAANPVPAATTSPVPVSTLPPLQIDVPTALKIAQSTFPTAEPLTDFAFHLWSWEAFVWATTPDANGVPRFLSLPTPADIFAPAPSGSAAKPRLTLGTRAAHATGGSHIEGTGAIVEADGNMLVSPNGYPVYASVHMNESYFTTAKANMIFDGGYATNTDPKTDHFDVGAAVFKATWLRLDPGQTPPAGAYTTQAAVPVLTTLLSPDNTLYVAPSGQTTTVTVALVGLHVVGQPHKHPEFLWGTFEHKANSPRFKDGTFNSGSTASDPKTYTFYQGGTPFNQTNLPSTQTTATGTITNLSSTPLSTPGTTVTGTVTTTVTATPTFTFDPATQKFSPTSNAVLANRTGGESNSPEGPANIENLNQTGQAFLTGQGGAQAAFANYELNGTVWMAPSGSPGSYNLTSNQSNAVGSVNLANVTAETFVQNLAGSTAASAMQNCFSCHNPATFTDVAPMPNLRLRRIALSHVLSTGSLYAVPNMLSVNPPPAPKP